MPSAQWPLADAVTYLCQALALQQSSTPRLLSQSHRIGAMSYEQAGVAGPFGQPSAFCHLPCICKDAQRRNTHLVYRPPDAPQALGTCPGSEQLTSRNLGCIAMPADSRTAQKMLPKLKGNIRGTIPVHTHMVFACVTLRTLMLQHQIPSNKPAMIKHSQVNKSEPAMATKASASIG